LLIAGNEARIDGADRGADDPIGLDLRFMQRLIDAGLVGAQCAAALKDQHGLTPVSRRPRRRRGCGCIGLERLAVHHVDDLVHWRDSAGCLLCASMMMRVADLRNDPTAAPWSLASRMRPAVATAAVKSCECQWPNESAGKVAAAGAGKRLT